MNVVERIVEEVKTLPEFQAREVLDFVAYLKAKQPFIPALKSNDDDADWTEFEKLAGAWSGNFNVSNSR